MPKKCPDKQQNEEEPPLSLGRDMPQPAPVDDEELSLGRDMPQPAPVDDEAFARRAGEIIGNSNTSLHKAGDKGAKMTTFRTRFTFRVDTWTPDGKSIVEHVAGVEDYQVALATFRAACERWPGTPITLRQGARVIEDSRRLRLV